MTRPIVSITVPIYKAEKYLRRCIESLTSQTLTNIEIILVDDGSPDRSGEICDEYAQKDSRIKVIHKENGGSASARQAGLEISTGVFYTVCDADDWVELDMYEELYNKSKESDADIVISEYYSNYPNGIQKQSSPYVFTTQEQYIEDLMLRKTSVSTCNKIFKLSYLHKFNINYEQGINLGEDSIFIFKILLHPIKIATINKAFYHYQRVMHSESYTNKISLKTLSDAEYVHNWKMDNYCNDRYKRAHLHSMINLAFIALRTETINKQRYKEIISQLLITDLIKYRVITIKSVFIASTKILGLKFGKLLLRFGYGKFYK